MRLAIIFFFMPGVLLFTWLCSIENLLCKIGWHRWIDFSETPIADGWLYKCKRCGERKGKVHYG